MQLLLIRHAHAGSRRNWEGDDEVRPLSKRGRREADALAGALAETGVNLLLSSRYLRCRETLEPLADQLAIGIENSDPYAEGGAGPVALDAALAAVATGRTVAVCSHGDVIPAVVEAACRRGATLDGRPGLAKAARFECTITDGQISAIRAVDAPDVSK